MKKSNLNTKFRKAVMGGMVLGAVYVMIILAGCMTAPKSGFLKVPVDSPTEVQQLTNEGVREFDAGSWRQAQRHLQQAVEADPSIPQTHYNLGLVLYRLGKGVAAEQHFVQASRLAPEDPVITNFRTLYDRPESLPESPQERPRRK
jgi:Tfp pilus assembly protein PilF